MNRDNQPTFNAGNRKIVNYKDFLQHEVEEEQELKDIKRSFTKNELDKGMQGHKYKYNKVTHKMDDLVADEVDDKLDVFDEALLTISKRVDVPESEIKDVIKIIKNWFEKNPEKDVCKPSIFGHHIWEVNKKTIEKDVRECAKNAHPYRKA